ncbi:toxin-antitoxin system YwqK family antitoxin [Anatilimnocola floriformis]|uniref:toxin-antitoxin system YwqK family antitoxin n=1 Tax=Anatilimnocola floriformis TaxID=2948575 RepID=UPI0020C3B0C1|nr:hypothetical protein [Anatilimnocola floriformis]
MSEINQPAIVAKPWYRRFKPWQFSLRTLLVLMAIASAACWYYLLPKQQDEKIAGGYLVLQRQYRGVMNTNNGNAGFSTPIEVTHINDGFWRIKDLEGNLLVDGHYRQDQQHGWWTTYHPNGRIAVQGRMQTGGRIGVWKTWDVDGQQVSEVTYVLHTSDQWLPHRRQGPAKYWHVSGKLAAAGKFDQDERSGKWEEWNEQGELIAAGEYQQGKKSGDWQERSAETQKLVARQYVSGLPKEVFDAQLEQLTKRIEQGDIAQQVTLLSTAVDFGPAALPLLEKWAAKREQPHVQFAAILAVIQVGGKSEPFAAALANISETTPQLAAAARWESYRHIPNSREKHLRPLLEESRQLAINSPEAAVDLLRKMFAVDPPNRSAIFNELLPIVRTNFGKEPWSLLGASDQRLSTAPLRATWQTEIAPYLDEALDDSQPENRRAAVMLIRQILAEREEFARSASTQMSGLWKIPPNLVPLVERARRDSDPDVKELAENVDKAYFSKGGFGGGGGLF